MTNSNTSTNELMTTEIQSTTGDVGNALRAELTLLTAAYWKAVGNLPTTEYKARKNQLKDIEAVSKMGLSIVALEAAIQAVNITTFA